MAITTALQCAEFGVNLREQLCAFNRGSVYGDFVRAGADYGAGVVEGADSASCAERDGELRSHAANGFEKSGTAIA